MPAPSLYSFDFSGPEIDNPSIDLESPEPLLPLVTRLSFLFWPA